MSDQPQKHHLSGPGDTWYVGEGGRPVSLPPAPYVPAVVPPDPARDARVAARRADDARRAGAALDRLLSGHGGRDVILVDAYYLGWDAGYAASEEHHNCHYGVSGHGPACARLHGAEHTHGADRETATCGGDLGPLRGRCLLAPGHEGPC